MEQNKTKKGMTKEKLFWLGIGLAGSGIWVKFGTAAVLIFAGLLLAALAYAAMINDCQENKTLSKGDGQG